jgi:phage shock protein A
MFNAIARWFKAVGYLLTGQVDSARRVLETNPNAVRAKYDSVIRDKVNQIHTYKQAVAGLIAQQENKIAKLKILTDEVNKLERLKAGALAKAKQTVAQFSAAGKSKEEIHHHEDYKKCLSAYNDFSSTLKEKQEHIAELEKDIESYTKNIGSHKVQLTQLLRDVENLKGEAADAVAEIITAKQEKEIADTLSGIASDGSAEELQQLRQLRQEIKAEARISKEMAGTDTAAQEAEFLNYARQSESSDEFDSLIGLGQLTESESGGGAAPEKEKLGGLPE